MVSSAAPGWRLVFVAATGGLLVAVSPGCGDGDTVGSSYNEIAGSGGDGGEGASGSGTPGPTGPTGPTGPVASSSTASSGGQGGSGPSSSSTGGAPCVDGDPAEPNESESSAYDLGGISDSDDAGSSRTATLADLEDVDWYKFKGDDTTFNTVDPTREITTQGSLRLCKYVQCDGGNAEVSCPGGTTPETSPDGRSGCCGTSGFDIGLECPGVDDNAWVYIRVDQPVPVCLEYTLAWHY